MNRDLSLDILQKLANIKNVLNNVVVLAKVLTREKPVIISQPENYVGPVGENAIFTVIAENVSSYQWETKKKTSEQWGNSAAPGNKTKSLSRTISDTSVTYEYRCKITGIDNSIIYSDIVDITIEEE